MIFTPGFNPSRAASRNNAGSRSETLLTTAGIPHAHIDSGRLLALLKGAAFLRYRMSMRIGFGIAQFGRDTILQLFGNEMLQTLGFFVNFFPRVIENIVKEALQKAMVPHHLQRALPAGRGKANSMMPPIAHE